MASTGGLSRRRGAGGATEDGGLGSTQSSSAPLSAGSRRNTENKVASDPRDLQMEDENKTQPKLTLMEEVLLLGLKDKQGYLSFWNDNISYTLRGCILMELAFRGRIAMVKDPNRKKYPLADRYIEAVSEKLTGEVLLDEALKMISSTQERMSVGQWIDLMSGETWNVMKIGFQLKQVRERLAKGLVDKGVLRTEKRNFLIFDMATHPVTDSAVKEEVVKRACTTLISRSTGSSPTLAEKNSPIQYQQLRTVTMVCAAYAANVLENALMYLNHEMRERAFNKVEELLGDYSDFPFGSNASKDEIVGRDLQMEIIAAVLNVFTKMDSIFSSQHFTVHSVRLDFTTLAEKTDNATTLAWASSRLGQALPNRWSATSDTTIKDRDGPCSGESASSRNAKEQQHQHVLQEQEHTHGPPHASAAATANHRYQSFSSVKDDLKSGIGPKGRTKQDKSLQQQQQHRQPESTKGSRSYPDGSQDGSFRASYSYSTPKTAMRTSLALLDTSSSALSNSILSRTRRASDRKMRQHQLEIQRDMAAPLMEQQLLADEVIVGSPSKSSLRERKSTQELQENEAEDEQDMDNDVETTTDSKARPTSSRRSSTVNRSIRYSFHGSTSPTLSIQHERSGSTTASKRHSLFNNSRQGSSSSRQLHRVLSGPIFIPNPRGIAPTPSPDVSMELVRKPFDATTSTSKAQTVTQVVSKDQLFRHSQEQLRRYETQLDERIQTVQANNQRLQELRSLMESQGMALTVRTVQCDGDEDSEYDDEEGEQQWRIESAERAEERLALEKTKDLLEQSLTKQQRLGEQLVQERSKNQELEARIEGMSSQLKGVLEMDLAQSKEIELVHEQTVKDREQWERQLRQEKQKREELQSSMEAAMAAKDRQFAESSAQERQSSDHESQALAAQVASLNQELEELKERMRRNETKAQAKLDQQEHQIHEHKDRGQELERQLEQERNRRDDDQEARVDDLIEEVEEKEQDVQELRVMLADYDELLQSRQSELNEAMELVESLQDQLQDHQTNHASDLQRIQEQHKKDQKQRHAEIRELKRELAQEKEASHEHQKRIELLLASHQESTQMHEGKIRDLQEELRQRNSQLSQSKSSASTVIKTVKGHLETIGLQQRMVEEQEQILLEKEGRIEELEQERKLAQQRHHTVVADLEQDVRGLERERAELVDMVKLARQQGMEERDDELTQDQEQERQMLESLLEELDPSFQIDSQQVDGNHSTQSDEGRRTVNQLYAILQEKIQEQKQHQLDLVMQRDLQEDKMDEQREQLEECETEIEAQHEQLLRLEADRRELEEQQIRIQGELDAARDDIQHLQRQLQDKNALKASKNAPLSGRASLSASRQRSSIAPNDDVQTLSLFDKISSLEQERARLLDHIKSLEESVQDLTEAGKTLRDKYEERVATLRQEVVKNRRLLVRQEGQLFLYLSVIEKLKIAMRDAKIEPPRDTKIEPSRDTTDTHANNKVGHGDQT